MDCKKKKGLEYRGIFLKLFSFINSSILNTLDSLGVFCVKEDAFTAEVWADTGMSVCM